MMSTFRTSVLQRLWNAILGRAPLPGPDQRAELVRSSENGRSATKRADLRRIRLAEAAARLQDIASERERRADPAIGKAIEIRIVWGELIDLELQDVDEQVARIRERAGGV